MLTATNRSNIKISKEIELKRFSEKTSKFIKKFNTVFLYGELGVGKTTFVKYLINDLQKKEKTKITEIPSPTFNINFEYRIKNLRIQHFDLYRLKSISLAEEVFFSEEEEALQNKAILVIEWPELIEPLIDNFWEIKISYAKNSGRNYEIRDPKNLLTFS